MDDCPPWRSCRRVGPTQPVARRATPSLALGDQLRRLEHADLEHEPGAKSIKLTLASVAQGQLGSALRRCLKDEVSRDVAAMAEGLQALQKRLEPALEAAAGVPVRLGMATPDSAALWGEISDMVSVDVRYRGEMPRRGFFQRLGEGRKAVFAGLMVLSLRAVLPVSAGAASACWGWLSWWCLSPSWC